MKTKDETRFLDLLDEKTKEIKTLQNKVEEIKEELEKEIDKKIEQEEEKMFLLKEEINEVLSKIKILKDQKRAIVNTILQDDTNFLNKPLFKTEDVKEIINTNKNGWFISKVIYK